MASFSSSRKKLLPLLFEFGICWIIGGTIGLCQSLGTPLFASEMKKVAQLEGEVTIENSMATINAGVVTYFYEKQQDKTIAHLLFENGLSATFTNGFFFTCEKGELNEETKEATFTSQTDCLGQMALKKGSLVIVSPEWHLLFEEDKKGNENYKRLPKTIVAEKGAVLAWQGLIVSAEKAIYYPAEEKISLSCQERQSCFIFQENGDFFCCDSCLFSFALDELHIEKPYCLAKAGQDFFSFHSTEAFCSLEGERAFVLHGKAALSLAALAVVKSDKIALGWSPKGETTVSSREPTQIMYFPASDSSAPCHLLAPGGLLFSEKEGSAIAYKGERGEQIEFKGGEGQLAADECRLFFSKRKNSNSVTADLLQIDGNIKMIYLIKDEEKQQVRAAAADHLQYDFSKEIVELKASPGKKVSIFDSENGLLATAPLFRVANLFSDKKQIVKGERDVRFQFIKGRAAVMDECIQAFNF